MIEPLARGKLEKQDASNGDGSFAGKPSLSTCTWPQCLHSGLSMVKACSLHFGQSLPFKFGSILSLIRNQQFDNLKVRAAQNFDQSALPTCLVFAETTSWNSALATDILHTVPLLRLRRRRPLRNHPALALLRAWKVQELWRHDSQCHWQD